MAEKAITETGKKRAPNDTASTPHIVKKRKRHEQKPDRANRREEKREVMVQAKRAWEQLRPKATSKEKSIQLVNDLIELLSGRVVEFVFRHDGSRIVQWMLADGNEKQKRLVLDELMEGWKRPTMEDELPFFVKLACDRYGHHLAFKVLRVADKKNKSLIYERYLRGNCTQLIRNPHGADVLDFAYQTVLRARSKTELVLELLYDKEKKLLGTVRARIFSERDEAEGQPANRPHSIFAQSLDLVDGMFRNVVVDSAGATLNQLVDKESLLRFEIVHAALKEYMQVVMESYPKEKAQELAALLAPVLVHLAHTKPGIHIAVNCVKILDAKHRKKVVRSLKNHIRKLLEDEYGHRLILALFEWVDDTKLVGKTISAEIFSASNMAAEMAELQEPAKPEDAKSASTGGKKKAVRKDSGGKETPTTNTDGVDMEYLLRMCQHKYARIPLLSLLCGRDTRYFNPDIYELVWKNIDTEKFGQLSKKDESVRRSELRMTFEKALGELMRDEIVKLLKSHWSAPVVVGALLTSETCESVTSGLKKALQDKSVVTELIEDTCGRKTLGTLFKVGGEKLARQTLDTCGVELLQRFTTSEGCMTIAQNLVNAADRADATEVWKKVTTSAAGL